MLLDQLQPMLDWSLVRWWGLPPASPADFEDALGPGSNAAEEVLGTRPAMRVDYAAAGPAGGLRSWFRDGHAVMVEVPRPPPLAALHALGEPSVILPQQILRPAAYVHEYLFCERGLVLSVAQPFDPAVPMEVVRCRGLKVLQSPREFGADFYIPFEDRRQWP